MKGTNKTNNFSFSESSYHDPNPNPNTKASQSECVYVIFVLGVFCHLKTFDFFLPKRSFLTFSTAYY